MSDFLKKCLERGLTPANVVSYLSLKFLPLLGVFWGTLRFRVKARFLGIEAGSGIRAHGPVGLMRWPGSHISVGDCVSFISSWRRATAAAISHPVRLRTFYPSSSISIGEGSQLTGASITCRSTSITLGKNVLVGPDVIIVDSDFHAPWPVSERPLNPGLENDRPVRIGDGAWIGMHSIILKGVTIGDKRHSRQCRSLRFSRQGGPSVRLLRRSLRNRDGGQVRQKTVYPRPGSGEGAFCDG